jgi:hypothetical protein
MFFPELINIVREKDSRNVRYRNRSVVLWTSQLNETNHPSPLVTFSLWTTSVDWDGVRSVICSQLSLIEEIL